MDKKDYLIQALTQQRNAALDDIANIAAQMNEVLAAKDARIKELEARVAEIESIPSPIGIS